MRRAGTRHHLAVVGGPDVGWVASLPEDRDVVVGRDPDADLSLADPGLSRRHLAVRDRRGRVVAHALPGGSRVHVRRARRRRSGRVVRSRRHRLRGRWRTLAVGSRVVAGGTTLEIRAHPGLAEPPRPARAVIGEGLGLRLLVPLAMSASMIPLALTSAATSPWRTATWLVLPVVLVVAVVWPWLRERAARRRRGAEPDEPQPPPPIDPPALLALVEHPWRDGARDLDAGSEGSGRRRRPLTLTLPEPGHGLAVVGPPDAARAMARWLLCQLAHAHPPEELGLTLPAAWDWATTLPHTASAADDAARHAVVIDTTERRGEPTALPRDAVGILVATSLTDVPTWCVRVLEVDERHDRRVSLAWADEVAAALRDATAAAAGLPDLVHLDTLLGDPTPADVLRRWRTHHPALVAPVGIGPSGPVWLDLAEAGPHALVAGTTGSGKSELLTTWVLGLALAHAPADLHVLLIDYKGGATFGALADLPHVVDVLTDLDTGTTARALAGLRAELARRERLLAEAGCRSLRELLDRGERLPRLLVVVDEFRTLADSHADLLDGLVRLAAQGRSLGIHLVLATQRPGGAVTADMRANISVRLCLRVLEQTDSVDVLGDPSAAALPAIPGRAVLRTDAATQVQIAWPGSVDDGVARLVRTVTGARELAAAVEQDLVAVTPPWAPPLSDTVPTADVPGGSGSGLPLLLVDNPDRQRLDGWHLELGDTLLVSGPPGSGRTTAARTLAAEAVSRGVVTHAVAAEPVVPDSAPARGTTCAPEDVGRLHQLLHALQRPDGARALLVIDDVDATCRALDAVLPYGSGLDLLLELLRSARRRGLGVVLTAAPPAARWAAATRHHLVLAPRDVGDALVAGVPRELVDVSAPAGRGILLDGRSARVGQVATSAASAPWPAPRAQPLRIEPLPDLVDLPAGTGAAPGSSWLLAGLGGPTCGPVGAALPDGGTWLVLGGPRSGRSTTLRTLAARLRAAGRAVWTDPAEMPPAGGGALVIDDADRLPAALAAVAAERAGQGVAIVAAARPDALAAAYHDLARALRDPDVVLALGSPAASPWTGPEVRVLAGDDQSVGRGVLVSGGAAVALRVDRCSGAQRTVPLEDDEGRLVAATDAGSSSPTATTSEAASAG